MVHGTFTLSIFTRYIAHGTFTLHFHSSYIPWYIYTVHFHLVYRPWYIYTAAFLFNIYISWHRDAGQILSGTRFMTFVSWRSCTALFLSVVCLPAWRIENIPSGNGAARLSLSCHLCNYTDSPSRGWWTRVQLTLCEIPGLTQGFEVTGVWCGV